MKPAKTFQEAFHLYLNYLKPKKLNPKGILYERSNYGLLTTLPLYRMFFKQTLDDMLGFKSNNYSATVANIGLLFEERDSIKDQNIKSILYSECKVGSYLGRLNTVLDFSSKHRQSLEKQLAQLEDKRREEAVKCWQDKAELVTEAMQAMGGYAKIKAKSVLMDNE